MAWSVLFSEQAAEWLEGLSDADFDGMLAAVERLEEETAPRASDG